MLVKKSGKELLATTILYWTYVTEHWTFVYVGTDLGITSQNQKAKVQTCTEKQAWRVCLLLQLSWEKGKITAIIREEACYKFWLQN